MGFLFVKRETGIFLLAAAFLLTLGVAWGQSRAGQQEEALRSAIAVAGLSPLTAGPRPDPAQVALGQALFFDKELSGNRDIACATCHQPSLGTGDQLPLSIGTGGSSRGTSRRLGDGRAFVARNAPDLYNRAVAGWQTMFWDGRVAAGAAGDYTSEAGRYLPDDLSSPLAVQAMFPVVTRDEMLGGWYGVAGYAIEPGTLLDGRRQPSGWYDVDIYGEPNELAALPNGAEHWPAVWDGLMARLLRSPGYQALFAAAYPDIPVEQLGFEHAANALAAFMADAFTFLDSPWDRYLAGDEKALSPEAKQGALLFLAEAGCAGCHAGNLLTDQAYHNIAVPQFGPGRDAYAPLDYGRYHVTGDPADRYAFRTPPLRNVTLSGPWFHNGAYDRLEDVVRHHLQPAVYLGRYDGRQLPPELRATLQDHPVTQDAILETLDPRLGAAPELSDREVAQLLAFLESLTDPAAADLDHLLPDGVPSGLPVD